MSTIEAVIAAVLVSPLVAAACVIVERVLRRFSIRQPAGSYGAVFGIGFGFLSGYLLFRGRPSFPPAEALEWLPFWTAALIGFGLVESGVRLPAWVLWLGRAVLTAGLLGVVLYPVREAWGAGNIALLALGIGVEILLVWGSLESLAADSRGASLPALLSLLAIALFATAVFSAKFLLLNILCAVLIAEFVATTLVSVKWSRSPVARGGISVATGVLSALAVMGYFYSDLRAACPILIGLVPIAIWAGRIASGRGPARRVRAVVVAVAVLALLGAAVWFADPVAFFEALRNNQY